MTNLETLQALDHGIEIGRGGVWLEQIPGSLPESGPPLKFAKLSVDTK